MAQLDAGATTSAATTAAGVRQLVSAGARNIAWITAGNSHYMPMPPNGPAAFNDAERDGFAHVLSQQMLVPLADSGVRTFLFDYETQQESSS